MATIFRDPLVVTKPADRVSTYPSSLRTIAVAATTLTLVLAAVPPPTVGRITELPPRAAHYPVTLRTHVGSQPAALQAAGPPWPAPPTVTSRLGPPYPPDLRSWSLNPSVALLQTPVAGYTPDQWTETPRTHPVYPLDLRTWTQGTLQTTLYFQPPAPPPVLVPDPVRTTVYPVDLRTLTPNRSLSLTVAPVSLPQGGHSGDLFRPPPYPVDLLTWTRTTLETPASGTPQAYLARVANVAPQPLNPWPIVCRTWTQNLLETTLAQPSTLPFAQTDWVLPRTTTYPPNLRTTLYYYVEDDNTPPQPPDFPNPRAAIYPLSLRTWTYNTVNLLSTIKPFAQTDYPNPRAAGYPPELRTTTLTLATSTLFTTPQPPAGGGSTATTRAAAYPGDLRTTAVNLRQTTLAPPASANPFAIPDFPNPRTAPYPTDLRTQTLNDVPVLTSTQPTAQHDWPAPIGPAYPASLRTTAVSLQQTTLFVAPVTPVGDQFTETPRAKTFPTLLHTFTDWNTSIRVVQVYVRKMIHRAVGGRSEQDNG